MPACRYASRWRHPSVLVTRALAATPLLAFRRSDSCRAPREPPADEVHEGDVEGPPGVRDERDRPLDVAPFPCLNRIVDDSLPFFNLEPDPFRGDQEGLHLVHELGELAVEELPVARGDRTIRLSTSLRERFLPILQQ